jgi:fimbrial chaperone protein
MKFNTLYIITTLGLSALIPVSSIAGGIGLSTTRVIYDESTSQATLPVTNSDSHEKYLIQAWVEDSEGNKSKDFIITPPLFASAPKSENTLRIVYVGSALPKDREKAYWVNVKAIPAVNPESLKNKNTLQLAILSRIKLFMRPQGLAISELDAMNHLSIVQKGSNLVIDNPTPYYQTLVNMTVSGKKIANTMVAPLSRINISTGGLGGEVKYQVINDYGALSTSQIGHSINH